MPHKGKAKEIRAQSTKSHETRMETSQSLKEQIMHMCLFHISQMKLTLNFLDAFDNFIS